jgi:hypothetical protein
MLADRGHHEAELSKHIARNIQIVHRKYGVIDALKLCRHLAASID